MRFQQEKFKDVLHYIISKCGNKKNVGKTVIYKLLYFSDFNFFELYEHSLTNEDYRKLPYGPAPIHFDICIKELENENRIKVETQEDYFNKPMFKYNSLKKPKNVLEPKELDVINDVISKLSKMNANQISEYSHGDMPWRATEEMDIIDYAYVFYRDPKYRVRSYESD